MNALTSAVPALDLTPREDGSVLVRSITGGPCGWCRRVLHTYVARDGQTLCLECDAAAHPAPAVRLVADSTEPDELGRCEQCGATDGLDAPCDCHLQDPGDEQ